MASTENISIGLVVACGILLVWNVILTWRLRRVVGGKNGQSLESSIVASHQEIALLKEHGKAVEAHLINVERRLKRSAQVIETVRFNAFKDAGGGQCFSTAILNELGDGVVLSAIYSRERVSVFGKPVNAFQSPHQLSSEESQAIESAKAKL